MHSYPLFQLVRNQILFYLSYVHGRQENMKQCLAEMKTLESTEAKYELLRRLNVPNVDFSMPGLIATGKGPLQGLTIWADNDKIGRAHV